MNILLRSLALLAVLGACGWISLAQVAPVDRTAGRPDSWLVLYNANSTESVVWADWYLRQWNIPAENALGLDLSTDAERILQDVFLNEIFYPVRDYLATSPDVDAKIMGILVGYRVPGNFYVDATHPFMQGGGGWSVSNNLQDLTSATWHKRFNVHHFIAYVDPDQQRLTKATLTPGFYMTARIDAPTLAEAQALTERAQRFTRAVYPLPDSDRLYYDYEDIGAPGGDQWPALRAAVESALLNDPPERFPWLAYESEITPTPDCAMQFSYYRLTGWDTVVWGGTPAGTRILAYAVNSFGATTVRSTTAHYGRFVPNALFNGGFAAAIGATAEPFMNNQPDPSTLVWCLAEGWTMGEAVFRAGEYHNYMWELVGDPLLRVRLWWGDRPLQRKRCWWLPAAQRQRGAS
jgi:uncharacterized protein (TIGR03790 family)